MLKKGQKVTTKDHKRTRHIFQNASVTPGTTTDIKGGRKGKISQVFADKPEYEVEFPGKTEWGNEFLEFEEAELETAV